MSCFSDLYAALWNATEERYAVRHDVSHELRDRDGRWAAGGKAKVSDVGPQSDRATIKAREPTMESRKTVIETAPGEWLMAYSPVGNVVHFTRDRSQAKQVDMAYGPSAEWARQALRIAKQTYQRKDARIA